MARARLKKICVDAERPLVLGEFWSNALDLELVPDAKGEAGLVDQDGTYRIWFNQGAEPKAVKHRLHLDVYARRVADLETLGAKVVAPEGDDRHWTVMADPEGGEFCAFLRDDVPKTRLHGVVVDSRNPTKLAAWWGRALKAEVVHHDGYSTVQGVKKWPDMTLDFVPVPERKQRPNRVHLDLSATSRDGLIERGATLIRAADNEIRWSVLTDPEGNEFCLFPRN